MPHWNSCSANFGPLTTILARCRWGFENSYYRDGRPSAKMVKLMEKHYVNHVQPGQTGFFATTVFDFVPAFGRSVGESFMRTSSIEASPAPAGKTFRSGRVEASKTITATVSG